MEFEWKWSIAYLMILQIIAGYLWARGTLTLSLIGFSLIFIVLLFSPIFATRISTGEGVGFGIILYVSAATSLAYFNRISEPSWLLFFCMIGIVFYMIILIPISLLSRSYWKRKLKN